VRRGSMGRKNLENEAEPQKNSAAPPTRRCQKIASLSYSDKRIRRGARATKAGGQPAALAALQKNDQHQDDAIDYEQDQKKRVKH
jgi:hypothetical protein